MCVCVDCKPQKCFAAASQCILLLCHSVEQHKHTRARRSARGSRQYLLRIIYFYSNRCNNLRLHTHTRTSYTIYFHYYYHYIIVPRLRCVMINLNEGFIAVDAVYGHDRTGRIGASRRRRRHCHYGCMNGRARVAAYYDACDVLRSRLCATARPRKCAHACVCVFMQQYLLVAMREHQRTHLVLAGTMQLNLIDSIRY